MSLDVRLLGQVSAVVDGGANVLPGGKQRAVTAMLAINRNRVVTADALADAVWDGNPPASAVASLQVFVSNIRKALRDAAPGAGADAALVTVGRGYRLDLTEDQCDIGRFESARRAGNEHSSAGRFDQAGLAYGRALATFRGDVVADLRGLRFADDFAVAMREEQVDVQSAMCDAEIAAGRAQGTLNELRRLVTAYPTREPLWRQLITALYLVGRQADALAACRELRDTLADQLGLDPSPALVDLEGRVLRQEELMATPAQQPERSSAFAKTESDAPLGFALPRGRLLTEDGAEFAVAGVTRIGRLPENDVEIDDAKVSREHAVITPTVSGFTVRDLSSSNGTFVDGRRVDGSAALPDGAALTVGHTELKFVVNPAG